MFSLLAVVNLTLVDLPGLTKVAVGMFISLCSLFIYLTFAYFLFNFYNLKLRRYSTEGQPDGIVQEIENMVRSYVEKVL